MTRIVTIILGLAPLWIKAQVSITTMGAGGTYSESFSGINTASYTNNTTYTWTDNSTLTGWYMNNSAGNFLFMSSLVLSSNTGRNYVFNMSGDKSIGFRASSSSTSQYWGLRLLNNTGSAASSFYLTYFGEQWSIAENQSPVGTFHNNTIAFSYQQGSTVTALTGGTWTSVAALNFLHIHSCTLAVCTLTANQRAILDGNLTSNRTLVSGCVDVAIPNGQEIMLRWFDTDDPGNDHHLQIDNVGVGLYNVACATVLPLDLLSFDAYPVDKKAVIKWSTMAENNLLAYVVEQSTDGFSFTELAEIKPFNRNQHEVYELFDPQPANGINYYRLKTIDADGKISYSSVKMVNIENDDERPLVYLDTDGSLNFKHPNEGDFTTLTLFNSSGSQVEQFSINSTNQKFWFTNLPNGVYLIQATGSNRSYSQKVLLQR